MPTVYLDVHYSITFNTNGGSGGPSNKSGTMYDVPLDSAFVISWTGSPSRTGYNFLGWSTSSSATSASYSNSYTFHAESTSVSVTLYAVWQKKTYTVSYRPGTSGTGSNYSQTKTYGVTLTLRGATYTRSGYTQVGWTTTDGGTKVYDLSASYTANAAITLYPVWQGQNSTISSLSSSVPIDGTTQGTLTLTRQNSSYLHRVELTFGNYEEVYTSVGTSLNFTIPTTWLAGLPNATSGTATCTVKTFSGSTRIGDVVSQNFTITVPASVVPTVSLSHLNVNDNSVVDDWNILLQGYSQLKLTATVSAGTGSTIVSIAFSGEGMSQTGTGTECTSEVLTSSGSKTWTVTVTDKRGRVGTATYTDTVHAYNKPSISSFVANRSLSDGTIDIANGTYIAATAVYDISSCDGNNSATVKKIEYKLHTSSTWTTGNSNVASGIQYVVGGGNIALTNVYDCRVTITDELSNSVRYTVSIQSVKGVSFGLNGECARFGGPVQNDDRFECDWKAQFNDSILTPLGDLSQTGLVSKVDEEAVSVATSTWTDVASITLGAGRWLIWYTVRFNSNATGRRQSVLSDSSGGGSAISIQMTNACNAVDGTHTYLKAMDFRNLSASTTMYLQAWQNSGSSLSVVGRLYAVRLA